MSTIKISGLVKRFGKAEAVRGIDLEVPQAQVTGLLGPSGCGKTTILRCIAGLEDPTEGEIYIDGRLVADRTHSVPPERRYLGLVFQGYALWPHMTVWQNVTYPLSVRGVRRSEIAPRAKEVLELLGLGELASRYPAQLSGGQQQRVALARNVVAQPRILLFDEPLSNLDANTRMRLRDELQRLLQRLGITSVYVTHDASEAMSICDRIVVLVAGRIEQDSAPADIYSRPATLAVAQLSGPGNRLSGRVADGRYGGTLVQVGALTIPCTSRGVLAAGASVDVLVRPEGVRLVREAAPEGAPMRIIEKVDLGERVRYLIEARGVELSAVSDDRSWQKGESGLAVIDEDRSFCFAAESGATAVSFGEP